jgi:hypothetical protein
MDVFKFSNGEAKKLGRESGNAVCDRFERRKDDLTRSVRMACREITIRKQSLCTWSAIVHDSCSSNISI